MSENVFVPEVEQKQESVNFATVTGVFEDGLTLRLDGEETPTEKRYKCNSFCVFKVDDRVRIIKDSGTYVAEYPVGNPISSFNADTAGSADSASSATIANTIRDNLYTSYEIRFRRNNGKIQVYHSARAVWVDLVDY